MSLSAKAFWACISFIAGASLYASGVRLSYSFFISLMLALLLLFAYVAGAGRRFLAASAIALLLYAGSLYARSYEAYLLANPFDARSTYDVQGIIASIPQQSGSSQRFIIRTDGGARILARSDSFYQLSYGDGIALQGRVAADSAQRQLLRRDRAVAAMEHPRIMRIEPARSISFRGSLAAAQQAFSRSLSLALPRDEAALSSGLLLGKQGAGFSRDMQEAMKNSGTTHIVALSGFNISLLIAALAITLGMLLPRRISFWTGLCCIALFVIMTGAEASAVRAALMGSLLLASQRISRPYSIRHAMALAALAMVLFNPFVMAADIGFLLSFAALLGIACLSPAAYALYRERGGWADKIVRTACDTACAQAAVLPILASQFGSVSAAGIASNILILPFIPATMGLAFLTGCAGLVASPAAQLIALPLAALAGFEIGAIRAFGALPPFSFSMGIWLSISYYACLWLAYGYMRRIGWQHALRPRVV